MKGLKEQLDKFGAHLFLQHRLVKSTVGNHKRTVTVMLKAIGTLTPTKDQLDAYAVSIYEKDVSTYHIANILGAIGRYGDFIGIPVYYPKPRKKKQQIPDTLTEAEVILILASCKNIREKTIIAILADSGIRNEELCSIKVKDINFSESSVLIHGKGGRDRDAFYSSATFNILKEYLQEYPRDKESHLFTTLRHGLPISCWAIRRRVKKIVSRSPVKKRVHPHLFRHSLATNMLDRGANIVSIQEQLGHSNIATTMIYVHARKDRVKAEYQLFRPRYF